MIKILEMDDVHTLGFRVDGKLDRADVKRIFDSFEKSLREKEDIKIYMEIENTNLGDISAGAYKEDIKFWLRHPALLPYFRKAALVTDSAWIERIFAIECALIPTLEGESFSFEEKDEALKWLRTDQRAESRMDITYPELAGISTLKFSAGFALGVLASGLLGKKHRTLLGSAIMAGAVITGIPLGLKILNNNRQLLNK